MTDIRARVEGTRAHHVRAPRPPPPPAGPQEAFLTRLLCSDTEMLLGCTSSLMHWLMLAANRLGSQARWHLSLREHLPGTHIHKRSGLGDPSAGLHGPLAVLRVFFCSEALGLSSTYAFQLAQRAWVTPRWSRSQLNTD